MPVEGIQISCQIQTIWELLTKEFKQHQFVVNVCAKDDDGIRALDCGQKGTS